MSKLPTHAPPKLKQDKITLECLPQGGFLVQSTGREDFSFQNGARAAFTTLDQTLEWLRENMARPAASKAT